MSNIENQTDYIVWLESSITDEHIQCYDHSDFNNIQIIGRGSYGDVFRVTWKNVTFALKTFVDKLALREVIKEVRYF
jgi:hypothetical protein